MTVQENSLVTVQERRGSLVTVQERRGSLVTVQEAGKKRLLGDCAGGRKEEAPW